MTRDRAGNAAGSRTRGAAGRLPRWKEPRDKPVASRRDDARRSRPHNPSRPEIAPRSRESQERCHREHNAGLPDLDPAIEGEERPAEGLAREPETPKHARETETVDESE